MKPEKSAPVKPGKSSKQPSLIVPALKSTASVSYRGLDAIVDPFGYKPELTKFQLQLNCQSKDKCWVDALAKLAEKKGIQIGESATGDRAIKVKYVNINEVLLEGSEFDTPLRDHVSIWKCIGALLGLFDYSDSALSAPTHQWLRTAEALIIGEKTSEGVVRELCNRLSSNDFLANYSVPSLGDYVLRSLIVDIDYLPNNVELWVKRLQ